MKLYKYGIYIYISCMQYDESRVSQVKAYKGEMNWTQHEYNDIGIIAYSIYV